MSSISYTERWTHPTTADVMGRLDVSHCEKCKLWGENRDDWEDAPNSEQGKRTLDAIGAHILNTYPNKDPETAQGRFIEEVDRAGLSIDFLYREYETVPTSMRELMSTPMKWDVTLTIRGREQKFHSSYYAGSGNCVYPKTIGGEKLPKRYPSMYSDDRDGKFLMAEFYRARLLGDNADNLRWAVRIARGRTPQPDPDPFEVLAMLITDAATVEGTDLAEFLVEFGYDQNAKTMREGIEAFQAMTATFDFLLQLGVGTLGRLFDTATEYMEEM